MEQGLVIRIRAKVWTVEIDGREVPCTLHDSLFKKKRAVEKNPVAVGDRVAIQLDGETGVIEKVLPRTNRLARPLPTDPDRLQVTAANIDRLVIVSATTDPPFRPGLIDRYLVAAERQDMDPLIVVNKCDQGDPETIREQLRPYEAMGYPVVLTSAQTGAGVEQLAEHLKDRIALLVGHSGVGKSSLLNRLDPTLALRTKDVARHGRGRHTTTSVSLFRLKSGGHVVDSPGIRGFGLTDVPDSELAILMPDLRPYTSGCKYPNCTHDHEPKCAVRVAVEEGKVSAERYRSYVRMLKGIQGEEVDED